MDEEEVVARLTAWGDGRPDIRSMILTSSRARPGAVVDALSDYDVIVVVTDAPPYGVDDGWQFDFGEPMVRWGDEEELHGLAVRSAGARSGAPHPAR
jgi:predicted nucleotidyltransferase